MQNSIMQRRNKLREISLGYYDRYFFMESHLKSPSFRNKNKF